MNQALKLVRAKQTTAQALIAEAKAKETARRERQVKAFEPIMALYNQLKNQPALNHRDRQSPLEKVSDWLATMHGTEPCELTFWQHHNGNYGMHFTCREDEQGNMRWLAGHYMTSDCKPTIPEKQMDMFIEFMASIIPVDSK